MRLGKYIKTTILGFLNENSSVYVLNDHFWVWFNKSKVVDTNGNPIVCYHGSRSIFNIFKQSAEYKHGLSYGALGNGFYFSDRLDDAQEYGSKIYKCYLKIVNPYTNILRPKDYYAEKHNIKYPKSFSDLSGKYPEYSEITDEQITDFLISEGFDGIISNKLGSTEYVYFNSNQIKSIENDGTWDIDDDNIYS